MRDPCYSVLKYQGGDLYDYNHTDPILVAALAQRKVLDYAIEQRIKGLADAEYCGDD